MRAFQAAYRKDTDITRNNNAPEGKAERRKLYGKMRETIYVWNYWIYRKR